MCDLDYLKIINDLLGHNIGDKVLKFAADAITEACSEARIIARIGGDEFAVIILNADISLLTDIREKILLTTDKMRKNNPNVPLYLSVGTGLKGHFGVDSIKEAFRRADQEMYSLKFANKDKVYEDIERIRNLHEEIFSSSYD
jgi:diguanylate cyclase (GGDEF)-like protein